MNSSQDKSRFVGNPLSRSCIDKKSPSFLHDCVKNPTSKWILFKSSKILFHKVSEDETTFSLKLLTCDEIISVVQVTSIDALIHQYSEHIIILGMYHDIWYISIDITSIINPTDLTFFNQDIFQNTHFLDGKKMLIETTAEDCAIAGQIKALYGFHKSYLYHPLTGERTKSCEGGLKRISITSSTSNHKVYPRIDPVMIACVVSPDFNYCLLGNMKHYPRGFYSCLSGFIEPCESVQEAVIREVWEESGIEVESVYLVDTQPWPLARSGGCELMIGCLAIAKTVEIHIHDTADVNAVRWFHYSELEIILHNQSHNVTATKTTSNTSNTSTASNGTVHTSNTTTTTASTETTHGTSSVTPVSRSTISMHHDTGNMTALTTTTTSTTTTDISESNGYMKDHGTSSMSHTNNTSSSSLQRHNIHVDDNHMATSISNHQLSIDTHTSNNNSNSDNNSSSSGTSSSYHDLNISFTPSKSQPILSTSLTNITPTPLSPKLTQLEQFKSTTSPPSSSSTTHTTSATTIPATTTATATMIKPDMNKIDMSCTTQPLEDIHIPGSYAIAHQLILKYIHHEFDIYNPYHPRYIYRNHTYTSTITSDDSIENIQQKIHETTEHHIQQKIHESTEHDDDNDVNISSYEVKNSDIINFQEIKAYNQRPPCSRSLYQDSLHIPNDNNNNNTSGSSIERHIKSSSIPIESSQFSIIHKIDKISKNIQDTAVQVNIANSHNTGNVIRDHCMEPIAVINTNENTADITTTTGAITSVNTTNNNIVVIPPTLPTTTSTPTNTTTITTTTPADSISTNTNTNTSTNISDTKMTDVTSKLLTNNYNTTTVKSDNDIIYTFSITKSNLLQWAIFGLSGALIYILSPHQLLTKKKWYLR